jgi:hypothetical protein
MLMKYAWLPLLATISPIAMAEPLLPTGGVACLSLKDAKGYADYVRSAPQFAADLLARAACYEVKDAVPAVKQGRVEQEFQAYTLLSGHKVWLPAGK